MEREPFGKKRTFLGNKGKWPATSLLLCNILICMPVVFISLPVLAQHEGGSGQKLEQLLENFFNGDEARDMDQYIQELQQWHENPLDINAATAYDLAALRFLSPIQITAILDYREKYGKILTVYELSALPEIGAGTAGLLDYVASFEAGTSARRPARTRHEVMTRGVRLLEKQAAYREPVKYEGSPEHLYLRYQVQTQSVRAGITGDKDAGESFFSGSNARGFDFYSGFAAFPLKKGAVSVLLGDYTVQFGQGLVVSQGFSLGKSAESITTGIFNPGFKAYTSSGESNFMRGISLTARAGRFSFLPFFSCRRIDANTEGEGEQKVFTSIQTSGYHRTEGEIDDRKSVRTITTGGNIRYERDAFALGFTGVHTRYEYPFVRAAQPWNRYLFSGAEVSNVGLDYRLGMSRLYLYGEAAWKIGGRLAVLSGILCQLTDRVELSAVYRNIARRYGSPLASSFTESSQVNDEEGFYVGVKLSPAPGVTVNAYSDFFRFRHVKYTTAGPGNGSDWLAQARYDINRDWQMTLRYDLKSKPVKMSGPYTTLNVDERRQSVRFSLSGAISRAIAMKTRVEQTFYRHDHRSSGFFIGQDFGYKSVKDAWNLWSRIAYFNTGDYDARIYAYENDLLYQFSIPAHYGKGVRAYLTGKVKICEKLEAWYKFSRTWFSGVESIGSGNSEIAGNKRTELKLQLRFSI